jgi:hypothetical protein
MILFRGTCEHMHAHTKFSPPPLLLSSISICPFWFSFSLSLCPPAPFLLGPFSGPFHPMLPTGSFLKIFFPFLSPDPCSGHFPPNFLLDHSIKHLTLTPPHILPMSMSTFCLPHTSTLKTEATWSSRTLVSNHHTIQYNNPENKEFKYTSNTTSLVK